MGVLAYRVPNAPWMRKRAKLRPANIPVVSALSEWGKEMLLNVTGRVHEGTATYERYRYRPVLQRPA